MNFSIIVFLLALIISLTLTPVVRYMAKRYNIVDQPKSFRKIHTRAIPRLGGIAIFIAVWGSVLALMIDDTQIRKIILGRSTQFWTLMGSSALILFIGIWDDIKSVKPWAKVIMQVIAGVSVYWSGFRFEELNTPFGVLNFGFMALPFTILWIVIISNAINLIDGMDGLAVGVCLVASTTILILSIISQNLFLAITMATLAGSALGFLVYNFYPASIFLGDSGSLLLGFLLATLTTLGSRRHAAVGLAIPLIVFALPIADTALAIIRRWSRRMPISTADKDHIHHRLLAMGMSQAQAVSVLYGFAIILGIIAIIISICNTQLQLLIGIFLVIALFFVLRILKWADFHMATKRIQRDVKRTRQRTDNWTLINQIIDELKYIKTEYHLKNLLLKAFQGLDLDRVSLVTFIPSLLNPSRQFAFKWYRAETDIAIPYRNSWTANLQIKKKSNIIGRLSVIQDADRSELPSDISECLKKLCSALADRLIPDRAILPSNLAESQAERNSESILPNSVLVIGLNQDLLNEIESVLNPRGWNIEFMNPEDDIARVLNTGIFRLIILNLDALKENREQQVTRITTEVPSASIIACGNFLDEEAKKKLFELGIIAYRDNSDPSVSLKHIIEVVI
ncbi:undecaprenyl/decaprenyl-phosphate alpha-N-acetylglucosaminyl 1-phosphate transferase [bacterium]|nr:undecaprenyl/decaprenyl-phosphate alpha-N-acetylglucosaminyl 1-phosphate transferase [candidate division CSSED10-310 bacterium]